MTPSSAVHSRRKDALGADTTDQETVNVSGIPVEVRATCPDASEASAPSIHLEQSLRRAQLEPENYSSTTKSGGPDGPNNRAGARSRGYQASFAISGARYSGEFEPDSAQGLLCDSCRKREPRSGSSFRFPSLLEAVGLGEPSARGWRKLRSRGAWGEHSSAFNGPLHRKTQLDCGPNGGVACRAGFDAARHCIRPRPCAGGRLSMRRLLDGLIQKTNDLRAFVAVLPSPCARADG